MDRFWIRGMTVCSLATFCLSVATGLAEEQVTIEPQVAALVVRIHGNEFMVLHHGTAFPKPYFWPVRASDGSILTRPIDPTEKEHPHHRGIWLAVDEVNDIKFWAERGKIATREVTSVSGNPARIELKNDWLNPDGSPAMIERTRILIYPNRLITYDITVSTPVGQLVRFDDTKEGFFGIRIAQSMRESQGGLVTNSEGKKTTQECWGQPAKWVDYVGDVEGKQYGVALMDYPGNFRPSRYHVRDYGLFSMSPFGEGAYQNDKEKARPVILDDVTPSLRIHYGLYVHDGNATDGKVTQAYDQFLKAVKDIGSR